MVVIAEKESKKALTPPYFPAPHYALIFRNFGVVPTARIAAALETTPDNVRRAAYLMGLTEDARDDRFLTRGFLSVIRANWHLTDNIGICKLLDISEERLHFILKEDDFFWVKMGYEKPDTGHTVWHEPTPKEIAELTRIQTSLAGCPLANLSENAYDFLDDFHKIVPENEIVRANGGNLRLIYSYFALYGDPLLNPELDPYPDALLAEYAKIGVNGIWLQGILYQLVPHSLCPEVSHDCDKRIEALTALVARAARFGIKVYLYFNEPRSLPRAFFKTHPDLAGQNGDERYQTLCTSVPEVQEYLEHAAYSLFSAVPGLGGFFTITRSENPTSCFSHTVAPCPRCAPRGAAVIVSEINNCLYRGAVRANPEAQAFAWTWGWDPSFAKVAVGLLDAGITVMNTSETAIPTKIGGIQGEVIDYSISQVGPGELALGIWEEAKKTHHDCAAKVQFNNSWELSAVPFLPVFSLIYRHAENLDREQVHHLLMSWTLGGAPSPSLRLITRYLETKKTLPELLQEIYGDAAEIVAAAERAFSDAFSEFPFDMYVLYFSPLQLGPACLFYPQKTGYEASMTGFPYDDLAKWRHQYPEEIFEQQFSRLCDRWKGGLDKLDTIEFATREYDEFCRIASAAYAHFSSVRNHIRFLRARNRGDVATVLDALRAEETALISLAKARAEDSRIGFEAANHYFYTLRDLQEKYLNLADCRAFFAAKKEG